MTHRHVSPVLFSDLADLIFYAVIAGGILVVAGCAAAVLMAASDGGL